MLEFFYDTHHEMLNEEQKEIKIELCERIDNDRGGLYMIDAPGGTGKTFLSNIILAYVRRQNKIGIATAMSGIAAILLTLGTTAHKCFGLPIPCYNDSSCSIKIDSDEARIIQDAKIIFIDEISMMLYKLLDCLDRFLQEIMHNTNPMGDKLVVLMGDFRQILPVIPNGYRCHIVSATIKNSELWEHVQIRHLRKNMRVEKMIREEPERKDELNEFANWLLELGKGTLQPLVQNIIQIPQHMVCHSSEEVRDTIYDNFYENFSDVEYLSKRAVMSCKNETVQRQNFKMVEQLPGELAISISINECVKEEHRVRFEPELLNTVEASGLPPHCLALKKNAVILLIRNLDVKSGHCNGTRYIIEDFTEKIIMAKKLNGDGSENDTILIPKFSINSKDTDFAVIFKRKQFPIVGAYYLTFNRAQGQSFQKCGLDLPESVFCHGQLYVGFGRCGDNKKLSVYANQEEFEHLKDSLPEGGTFTRNVVYTEVFE